MKTVSISVGTKEKTSQVVLGWWFHIIWNGDSGVDQHGNGWVNKKAPVCLNTTAIDVCLDTYNDLIKHR